MKLLVNTILSACLAGMGLPISAFAQSSALSPRVTWDSPATIALAREGMLRHMLESEALGVLDAQGGTPGALTKTIDRLVPLLKADEQRRIVIHYDASVLTSLDFGLVASDEVLYRQLADASGLSLAEVKRRIQLIPENEASTIQRSSVRPILDANPELGELLVDALTVDVAWSKAVGRQFEAQIEEGKDLAYLLNGAMLLLADLADTAEESQLAQYFNDLLNRPQNRDSSMRILVSSTLDSDAVRRFDPQTQTVEILFSERFIRAVLRVASDRQNTRPAMLMVAQRLYHELGHDNNLGTLVQEQAEEAAVIEQDYQLINELKRHRAELYQSERALAQQMPSEFLSENYFDWLEKLPTDANQRRIAIQRFVETHYAEYSELKAMARRGFFAKLAIFSIVLMHLFAPIKQTQDSFLRGFAPAPVVAQEGQEFDERRSGDLDGSADIFDLQIMQQVWMAQQSGVKFEVGEAYLFTVMQSGGTPRNILIDDIFARFDLDDDGVFSIEDGWALTGLATDNLSALTEEMALLDIEQNTELIEDEAQLQRIYELMDPLGVDLREAELRIDHRLAGSGNLARAHSTSGAILLSPDVMQAINGDNIVDRVGAIEVLAHEYEHTRQGIEAGNRVSLRVSSMLTMFPLEDLVNNEGFIEAVFNAIHIESTVIEGPAYAAGIQAVVNYLDANNIDLTQEMNRLQAELADADAGRRAVLTDRILELRRLMQNIASQTEVDGSVSQERSAIWAMISAVSQNDPEWLGIALWKLYGNEAQQVQTYVRAVADHGFIMSVEGTDFNFRNLAAQDMRSHRDLKILLETLLGIPLTSPDVSNYALGATPYLNTSSGDLFGMSTAVTDADQNDVPDTIDLAWDFNATADEWFMVSWVSIEPMAFAGQPHRLNLNGPPGAQVEVLVNDSSLGFFHSDAGGILLPEGPFFKLQIIVPQSIEDQFDNPAQGRVVFSIAPATSELPSSQEIDGLPEALHISAGFLFESVVDGNNNRVSIDPGGQEGNPVRFDQNGYWIPLGISDDDAVSLVPSANLPLPGSGNIFGATQTYLRYTGISNPDESVAFVLGDNQMQLTVIPGEMAGLLTNIRVEITSSVEGADEEVVHVLYIQVPNDMVVAGQPFVLRFDPEIPENESILGILIRPGFTALDKKIIADLPALQNGSETAAYLDLGEVHLSVVSPDESDLLEGLEADAPVLQVTPSGEPTGVPQDLYAPEEIEMPDPVGTFEGLAVINEGMLRQALRTESVITFTSLLGGQSGVVGLVSLEDPFWDQGVYRSDFKIFDDRLSTVLPSIAQMPPIGRGLISGTGVSEIYFVDSDFRNPVNPPLATDGRVLQVNLTGTEFSMLASNIRIVLTIRPSEGPVSIQDRERLEYFYPLSLAEGETQIVRLPFEIPEGYELVEIRVQPSNTVEDARLVAALPVLDADSQEIESLKMAEMEITVTDENSIFIPKGQSLDNVHLVERGPLSAPAPGPKGYGTAIATLFAALAILGGAMFTPVGRQLRMFLSAASGAGARARARYESRMRAIMDERFADSDAERQRRIEEENTEVKERQRRMKKWPGGAVQDQETHIYLGADVESAQKLAEEGIVEAAVVMPQDNDEAVYSGAQALVAALDAAASVIEQKDPKKNPPEFAAFDEDLDALLMEPIADDPTAAAIKAMRQSASSA